MLLRLVCTLALLGSGAAALLVGVGRAPLPETPPRACKTARLLPPGLTSPIFLPAGKSMFFRLPRQRGEVLDVVVEQDGIDAVVRLWPPWGPQVLRVDGFTFTNGPEPAFAVADEDGSYCLQIDSTTVEEKGPRAIRVRLAHPRPVSARDQIRAAAHLAYSRAEALREKQAQAALPLYKESLALFRATGERERLGSALFRMGFIQYDLDDYHGARTSLAEAADAFAGTREEALADVKLGSAYENLGQIDLAQEVLERGLGIARHFGDRLPVIGAQMNLGRVLQAQGKLQEALRSFTQALKAARQERRTLDEAKALVGLADFLLDLGNLESARDTALEAIRIEKAQGYSRQEAISRRTLAQAYLWFGDRDAAAREAKEALRLARQAGDPAEEAEALKALGDERSHAQRPEEALRYYEEALARARPTGNHEVTARALMGVGVVRGLQGDRELKDLEEAENLFQQSGDEDARAWALEHRALVLRHQGRLEEARSAIEQALQILDPLRGRPASPYLRSSFLASRYSAWELAVDILVELEKQEPGRGYGARSFEIGERARARTFLDDLAASGAVVQPRITPEMERRQADIEQQLAVAERAGRPEQTEAVRRLHIERDLLEEQIRKAEPGYFVAHAQSLTLPETQALLDDKTTLLAYMLGDERSFLWRVRRDSLECLPLPARKEIEAQAKAAHDALEEQPTRRTRGSLDGALAQIFRTVLGPVAARLGQDRLLVVSDGALQTVPFSVLPDSGRRLVETHDVVDLPSVSIVAALQHEAARRKRPPKLLALLADPVYGEDDDRFPAALRRPASPLPPGPLADLARSIRDLKLGRFPRIPATGDEAEAILRMVPPGLALRALGFEANLSQAKAPGLADYRFLHFATHGVFDAGHPELSGLVLSRFDKSGHREEQDGFLRAYEIEHLRLPVDLVVLSACQTALGSEVRGEGLSGLPRSFMYAGAPRVVVSLWPVSDKATAHLMEVFYRGLLRQGLRPAEALRAAQREMMQSHDWHEPYYWAGFVLNGDWH